MRIIAFPDRTFGPARGCRLIKLADNLAPEEIDEALRNEQCATLYTFTGSETGLAEELTGVERALIEEGLSYTEANGAPAMRMRPETKRMAAMCASIDRKIRRASSIR
jgi:hypothetical protein